MMNLQYLVEQFSQLTEDERNTMFQIMTDNKELFNKLFPNIPLLMHILDPNGAVPQIFHGDIIQAYNAWAQENNKE
jgi:flavorubredoxin